MRIDKWLWASRLFKTRALASKACELGRIESNGQQAKPARDVKVGDWLKIKNEGGEFHIEVLGLSEIRGPAPTAQDLYREPDDSRDARIKLAEERKAMMALDGPKPGKPSKKDRRWRDQLRGNY